MTKQVVTLLLLIILSISVQAQSSTEDKKIVQHVVHLKNGSSLIGQLIQFSDDAPVVMIMGDGEQITVPRNLVESVARLGKKLKKTKLKYADKPYAFQETGWHYKIGLSYIERGNLGYPAGYSIEVGTVYHFSRMLGIGLHTGVDVYDSGSLEKIIPIYVNVQGYINSKKVTPFYSFGIGIGIPNIEEEQWDDLSVKAGLLLYPKVGIRITGNENSNITFFTGYKIQNSSIRTNFNCLDSSGPCDEFIEQRRIYRRLVLGVDFIF